MASQYAGIPEVPNNDSSTVLADTVRVPMKRAWSGFFMAAIEAVCVFYIMAAKAGFVLVSANIAAGVWASVLHQDIFRIPLLLLALTGSGFNLYLLWNAHRLRNAPAAAWRKKPLTKQEQWRIRTVFLLSLATVVFAGAEVYFHRLLHHTAF